MVYGCGNQTLKFVVFVANLLIFIFGALVCGFSLWNLSRIAHEAKIDDSFVTDLAQYKASLWVLVAVGALLLVVGFLGCCGAACESLICMTLFFIVIFILSLIELATLVYFMTNRTELFESLHKVLEKYTDSADKELHKQLKPIQDLLHCCGATFESKEMFVKEGLCTNLLPSAPDCFTAIQDKLYEAGEVVVVVGIILLIIQFFTMIFSCVLCRAFRERYPAYYA
ncbi:Protein TSP-9 [Aphelenchoides avenae]|nr:Protein TSP-9 [Aphelenchus avenae]